MLPQAARDIDTYIPGMRRGGEGKGKLLKVGITVVAGDVMGHADCIVHLVVASCLILDASSRPAGPRTLHGHLAYRDIEHVTHHMTPLPRENVFTVASFSTAGKLQYAARCQKPGCLVWPELPISPIYRFTRVEVGSPRRLISTKLLTPQVAVPGQALLVTNAPWSCPIVHRTPEVAIDDVEFGSCRSGVQQPFYVVVVAVVVIVLILTVG